jgi:hypothetical protein
MKKNIFIAALLLIANISYATTFHIKVTTNYLPATDPSISKLHSGDTIMLDAGPRCAIKFSGITGAPGKYITIINANGLCEITTTVLSYGISLDNCHYIRLTGTMSKIYPYGIKVNGVNCNGGGVGLGISNKSDNIEVCHLEICNTIGQGILCKTDPGCQTDTNSVLNTSIHDNYIHHTGSEGMYIGYSDCMGLKFLCGSDSVICLPPLLKNVQVFNNLVDSTGYDGIQISCSIDVVCYHNQIFHDSQKNTFGQNTGLIIGGGASGRFYENTIANGKGYPINCFGNGNIEITGNLIRMDSTLTKSPNQWAIYINDKVADQNTTYKVTGNTINTQYYPAIKIVNNNNRNPDILKDNIFSVPIHSDIILYEGKEE